MERRLIAVLSVALGAAILVIVFLAGRLTAPSHPLASRAPIANAVTGAPMEASQQPAPVVESDGTTAAKTQPLLQPETIAREQLLASPQPAPRVEVPATSATTPVKTRVDAAISAYFAKMDSIQVAGSGDPSAFAQGMVDGLERGNTSQIDAFVNDAKLALAQATVVNPPVACAEYHRRLIELMSESVAAVDKMRTAIGTGDIGGMTALVSKLQDSQQKANELELLRKQLLGN